MQKYIGSKQINGVPMTRREYNDFRDWIEQTMTISEAKKGIPCERCNKPC